MNTTFGKARTSARDEKRIGRETILTVLARAAEDEQFMAQMAENSTEALSLYYTLTPEEMAALISGDIKTIEGWVGKLDRLRARWLWNRLSQEKW